MKMRRNVMILAVVALVAFAGSAFAYGHGGWGGGHCMGARTRPSAGEAEAASEAAPRANRGVRESE